MNYHNEIDPFCAAWLQNLMDAGHIAPGVIDTRSIEDVRPDELAGYTQCHFFAGIGVWSLALRAAGWPDSRPAWTGSCPCQPFSAAGKGAGFADERHLWPAWQHLINQCRPPTIFGEQVASKAVDAWIDLVHADLEGMGYAFGGIAFPSAGVGAPHIRDRTFWVGHADGARLEGHAGHGGATGRQGSGGSAAETGVSGGLADPRRCKGCDGLCTTYCDDEFDTGLADEWLADSKGLRLTGQPLREAGRGSALGASDIECAGGVGSADGRHAGAEREQRQLEKDRGAGGLVGDRRRQFQLERPGPTNGFWRAADWLGCTDGKWRPVEPGTFPLVDGASSRVGRLRAYGNAINAQAAAQFIGAYLDLSRAKVA